ncbi:MAG: 3-methyl-2-oxobutanoate hydroxymethyltransferase [Desulfovibrionaceae bacterium]
MQQQKVTAPDILAAKGQRRLAMLTASDYPTGLLADAAGADMVLVGDSLAMVALGHEDTLSVTMDEMLHHCRAVARGAKRALVVGDLPFMSYQPSVETAVRNAGRYLAEGGARAVKMEGGRDFAPHARAMVRAGIPVMGHIGLTPQHIANLGGFRAQGRTAEAVRLLLEDARAMAEAGCFALVIEAVPAEASAHLTAAVPMPTIGIGAGPHCDGQVLVMHDVLGLFDRFTPRFVKPYAKLGEQAREALEAYCREVREGVFPDHAHSFHLKEEERRAVDAMFGATEGGADRGRGPDHA